MERRIETYLNDGLYRNTCQKLNIFVKNVKKNFSHGFAKIKNSVQMSVDINGYIGQQQKKEKLVKNLSVNFAEKCFMSLAGKKMQTEESIAHKNVIGKTNQKNILAKETHNIKMEEQKNIQSLFIFQLNGEECENGYTNEIIMNVNFVGNMAENYMPIISYQLENAKTLSENQILSRCVESAINNITVLNNRTGGEHEFYK